ncbi:ROK family protein [Bacteroidales bacterium OttesenSCG-928-B11]|nr:ROK family protein [Bacteroidales bacterium OttesenSCG-928-E04]MDL2309356.1 ROK family protein [Bacteroidales bacterium OttesenSCG-928-C03]MDL2313128.1 ROK family protein [Bacteroidales bacterium OttesenSCG-928-B11]
MYSNDKRTVVTLDAGGSNFEFSAIQGNKVIVEPIRKPSNSHDLDLCIATMKQGFEEVMAKLDEKPVAISFAFPGPADYPNGIIGGFLPNFPSFRDGVALGPLLQRHFNLPVFINNDADLFVYGEALAGALPEVNRKLADLGSAKQYQNLLGFTWGTGFGFGFVVNNNLHIGDNSCSEIYCLPHPDDHSVIVEDGVAIRAVTRVYGEWIEDPDHGLSPAEICDIAKGKRTGNQEAAIRSFEKLGEVAGDAIAYAVTLIDGIMVIGGGLAAAHEYIMPSLLKVLRSKMHTMKGETLNRLQFDIYDLDNEDEFAQFAKGKSRELKIYGSEETVVYDPNKRVGITISKLGAGKATALGAYAYALHKIDA